MTATSAGAETGHPPAAAPFWVALMMPVAAIAAARLGGWALLLLPGATWWLFAMLDSALGRELSNADPTLPDTRLRWHRALTLVWVPVQFTLIFGLIWYCVRAPHLGALETVGLFAGLGIVTGTVGINYSHELMHQKPRIERRAADLLLAMVLYCHFRSEHLLVHHRHVATPRDPATARYGEGFYRFFLRVLWQSAVSSWQAEAAMQARRGAHIFSPKNPFWRYAGLQIAMLTLAYLLGGWVGVGLFTLQAIVAIWHLELVNYIEHYGLVRRNIGDGRYEPVRPHHSWNATQKASNWLLINLQRHSDHHFKPERRYPLLQNHPASDAPQLPHGYTVMGMAAMIPPLWRRMMNPRVRAWRACHYADVEQ